MMHFECLRETVFLHLEAIHSSIHSVKLREGVFFTGVCLFTGGPQVTITHDELDSTGTYSLLVTPGGHHWRHRYLPLLPVTSGDHWSPVKTCSFGDPHSRATSGGGH